MALAVVGTALAGAAASFVVGKVGNAILGSDSSSGTSSSGSNGGGYQPASSSIQNTPAPDIGQSEAAKVTDPTEQMKKWNNIFSNMGNN